MPIATRRRQADLQKRVEAVKNVKVSTLDNGFEQMCISDSDEEKNPVKKVSTASRKRRHSDAFDADDEAVHGLIDSDDDCPLPVKQKGKPKTRAKAKAKQRNSKPGALAQSSLPSIPEEGEPNHSNAPASSPGSDQMMATLPITKVHATRSSVTRVTKVVEPKSDEPIVLDIASGSEGDDESSKTDVQQNNDEAMQAEEESGEEGDSEEDESEQFDSSEETDSDEDSECSDQRMTQADVPQTDGNQGQADGQAASAYSPVAKVEGGMIRGTSVPKSLGSPKRDGEKHSPLPVLVPAEIESAGPMVRMDDLNDTLVTKKPRGMKSKKPKKDKTFKPTKDAVGRDMTAYQKRQAKLSAQGAGGKKGGAGKGVASKLTSANFTMQDSFAARKAKWEKSNGKVRQAKKLFKRQKNTRRREGETDSAQFRASKAGKKKMRERANLERTVTNCLWTNSWDVLCFSENVKVKELQEEIKNFDPPKQFAPLSGTYDHDTSEEAMLPVLKECFGYDGFRPGQYETVKGALQGDAELVVLPTGRGKSLCYQLSTLLLRRRFKECITLVVTPLISLMSDQLERMPKCLKAAAINSNQSYEQTHLVMEAVRRGKIDMLFVAPERLALHSFAAKLPPVGLAVIDEAHCVSEWSHNFRPTYWRLHTLLNEGHNIDARACMALTATATQRTALSICSVLRLTKIVRATRVDAVPKNCEEILGIEKGVAGVFASGFNDDSEEEDDQKVDAKPFEFEEIKSDTKVVENPVEEAKVQVQPEEDAAMDPASTTTNEVREQVQGEVSVDASMDETASTEVDPAASGPQEASGATEDPNEGQPMEDVTTTHVACEEVSMTEAVTEVTMTEGSTTEVQNQVPSASNTSDVERTEDIAESTVDETKVDESKLVNDAPMAESTATSAPVGSANAESAPAAPSVEKTEEKSQNNSENITLKQIEEEELPEVPKVGAVVRPNIRLTVEMNEQPMSAIFMLLNREPYKSAKSIIIYCWRRATVDFLAGKLTANGHAALAYHASLSGEDRSQVQRDFMSGKVRVIVATVAFGMGLDKPDVRAVIHYNMPKSLENYVQETGRVARDGSIGYAHCFLSKDDYRMQRRMAFADGLDDNVIINYLQTNLLPNKKKDAEGIAEPASASASASSKPTVSEPSATAASSSAAAPSSTSFLDSMFGSSDATSASASASTEQKKVDLYSEDRFIHLPESQATEVLNCRSEEFQTILALVEQYTSQNHPGLMKLHDSFPALIKLRFFEKSVDKFRELEPMLDVLLKCPKDPLKDDVIPNSGVYTIDAVRALRATGKTVPQFFGALMDLSRGQFSVERVMKGILLEFPNRTLSQDIVNKICDQVICRTRVFESLCAEKVDACYIALRRGAALKDDEFLPRMMEKYFLSTGVSLSALMAGSKKLCKSMIMDAYPQMRTVNHQASLVRSDVARLLSGELAAPEYQNRVSARVIARLLQGIPQKNFGKEWYKNPAWGVHKEMLFEHTLAMVKEGMKTWYEAKARRDGNPTVNARTGAAPASTYSTFNIVPAESDADKKRKVEEAKARSQARKQQEAEDRKKAVDHKTSAMGTSQSSFQVGGSMLF